MRQYFFNRNVPPDQEYRSHGGSQAIATFTHAQSAVLPGRTESAKLIFQFEQHYGTSLAAIAVVARQGLAIGGNTYFRWPFFAFGYSGARSSSFLPAVDAVQSGYGSHSVDDAFFLRAPS